MKIQHYSINLIKFLISYLFNFRETKVASNNKYSETVRDTDTHIKDAADWLLESQESSIDDGYSRCYSLYSKTWDKGYIETTGYIIPSIVTVGKIYNEEKYIKSGMIASEWILDVQNNDGSFNDIDDGKPQVFDTGQCLIGLIFLFKETIDKRFLMSALKAGDWLCETQDSSGTWTKFSYNNEPHTYYTRVASALLQLADISKNSKYYDSGLKNIYWCINQQNKNGFFNYSSFIKNEESVLHTMIYIIEGLLEAYLITKDKKILESVLKNTETLKNININRDIILYSRYNKNFDHCDKSRCITGLAQWAGVCIDLFEITNDKDYLRLAKRTIYYLKSKQIDNINKNLKGGFFGSIPFHANYGTCKLLNWNNKFFIDTLLKYKKFNFSIDNEHDEWVTASFEFGNQSTVNLVLTEHDMKYIEILEPIISKIIIEKGSIKLLDLGCGKGKFINYFKNKYKNIEFFGVDPVFYDDFSFLSGTATSIPFEDNKFDIVIVIEVLQHVRVLKDSLSEINRVMKLDGSLFIGERNKFSLLGLLKKYMERKGYWMYVSDSPYTEKWYKKGTWKNQLDNNYFDVILIKNINPLKSKFPLMNRYLGIVAKKI